MYSTRDQTVSFFLPGKTPARGEPLDAVRPPGPALPMRLVGRAEPGLDTEPLRAAPLFRAAAAALRNAAALLKLTPPPAPPLPPPSPPPPPPSSSPAPSSSSYSTVNPPRFLIFGEPFILVPPPPPPGVVGCGHTMLSVSLITECFIILSVSVVVERLGDACKIHPF